MRMINLLKLGQGPRPDLLEEEIKCNREREIKEQEQWNQDGLTEQSQKKEKGKIHTDLKGKDVLAMIIALFQLILPWLVAGILIYFLFILFITKI